MNTTYLDFFGLNDDPFRLTPDPAYFYPSHEHANALLSLDYILNNREGFCLLTGEPGTGKNHPVANLHQQMAGAGRDCIDHDPTPVS